AVGLYVLGGSSQRAAAVGAGEHGMASNATLARGSARQLDQLAGFLCKFAGGTDARNERDDQLRSRWRFAGRRCAAELERSVRVPRWRGTVVYGEYGRAVRLCSCERSGAELDADAFDGSHHDESGERRLR